MKTERELFEALAVFNEYNEWAAIPFVRVYAPHSNDKYMAAVFTLADAYAIGRATASASAATSTKPADSAAVPCEPVGHLYTIAGIQHCTIEKVLPDGPLYTTPQAPAAQPKEGV